MMPKTGLVLLSPLTSIAALGVKCTLYNELKLRTSWDQAAIMGQGLENIAMFAHVRLDQIRLV